MTDVSSTVQDKAAELIAKLYREGQANVEAVTSPTTATATVVVTAPNAFSTTVLTLHGATPVIELPEPSSAGQRKRIYVVQDGTGSRIPTWAVATAGSITWLAGSAPILLTAAGAVDRIDFESDDGINWVGSIATQAPAPITSTDITAQATSGTDVGPATAPATILVTITGGTTGTVSIAVGPGANPALPIVGAAEPAVANNDMVITFRIAVGDHYKITVGGSAAITKVYSVNR